MPDLAERLLEAHVQHQCARLQGDSFRQLVEQHVGALFTWLQDIPLTRLVTQERILATIDRFVVDFKVSGGITELAGEMARVVVSSRANESARVSDVLATSSFHDFADKLVALEPLRRELIGVFVQSSALSDAAARLLSHRLSELLAHSVEGPVSPLPQELRARLRASALPELERRLATWLFQYFEQHRERFSQDLEGRLSDVVNEAFLRALLDDMWTSISQMSLSHVMGFMGEQDLEDAVVFVFEFWLRFRKTAYFRQVVGAAVSHFFAKYGSESVAAIIEDMGVTRAMVTDELVFHALPWLTQARETGFLQQRLREELRSFYASTSCAEILNENIR